MSPGNPPGESQRPACFSVPNPLESRGVAARVPVLAGAPTEEEGCTRDCDVCRRLRDALLEALASQGAHALEAADVAARAELAEAELVAHYGSVERCLAATYDQLSDELYHLHVDAFDGPGDWRSRFLDGVGATLDRIGSTPGAVRLFFADDLLAHPRLRTRRAAARQRVVRLVAEEVEHEQDQAPPPVQVEFLLGAVSHAARTEMAAGTQPARVAARVSETLRLLGAA
jgi:AcrR family transcriptional regulator